MNYSECEMRDIIKKMEEDILGLKEHINSLEAFIRNINRRLAALEEDQK